MTRLLAGALLCALCMPALAHDHWINHGGYTDPENAYVHCCGVTGDRPDCFEVSAEEVGIAPEGYVFKPTGETIPYSKVYDSEDGRFWRCRRSTGMTRCFFAPKSGS